MSRLSCILSAFFIIGTAAGLGGCSTTLAMRAPRGVDLSGEWQIDLALSDFPQEAVSSQSAVVPPDLSGGSGGSGSRGGRGRGGRGMGRGGGGPAQAGGPGRAGSPEHHFAMPPHLSISQSTTGLSVNITMPDGKHVTNVYVSGEKSSVTTTRGAADRTLGWDSDSYLIRTKVGEKGPQSEVRYSLDDDGTLSVISTISNSGIYDFQYTLEYDHVKP
ncbi:MAG TPA: hypothetical protein VHW25_08170 [Steroidobacteraceae bacterium]|nr:hypothetical protein [Steroidobacteraceae bacterium]